MKGESIEVAPVIGNTVSTMQYVYIEKFCIITYNAISTDA